MRIADKVENHKTSVLVHCSDGWDRTAQVRYDSSELCASNIDSIKWTLCLLLTNSLTIQLICMLIGYV